MDTAIHENTSGVDCFSMVMMTSRKKILFITQVLPFPPDGDGARRITANFLQHLSADFDITLLSYVEEGEEKYLKNFDTYTSSVHPVPRPNFSRLSKALSLFRSSPALSMVGNNRRMSDKTAEVLRQDNYDLVYVDGQAMAPCARDIPQPKIISPHDAPSLFFTRRAEQASGGWKWIYRWEAWRLKKFEKYFYGAYDRCCVVSEVDCDYLTNRIGMSNVFVAKNGVDTVYFAPDTEQRQEKAIIFTGVMDYAPNTDAALFLCREIMPLLWKHDETLKLYIVGKNPPPELLAQSNGNIEITGFVEDIRPFIDRAAIYVSPLRYGTGVKNKILEAMAMAKPVVASGLSMEGLDPLVPYMRQADTPVGFAKEVTALLAEPTQLTRLGSSGRDAVIRNYSWGSTFATIKAEINALIAERQSA